MVDVAEAFVWACTLDVAARKPGNVSWASAGHRMQAQQFIGSAMAAAPAIAGSHPGQRVGPRIESAMRATLAAVGCNTNLGIVLLCAPLAVAAEQAASAGDLRPALQQVLGRLDLADAQAAFRAIALTQPAGLGRVAQQDVHTPPSLGLREAMALAAGRDSVARQYEAGYADLFDLALGWFGAVAGPPETALQRVFLEALVRWPDSHIVRKHGEAAAHTVMQEALPWCERARAGQAVDAQPAWAAWDQSLKARGLNPGTSADLCVATAFLWRLLHPHMTLGSHFLAWQVQVVPPRRAPGPGAGSHQRTRLHLNGDSSMAKIDRMLVGESLVGDGNEVAHIDLLIGPRGSPVESAFANALTNNKDGFTSLLAVVAPNLLTKPATVMFNKVTIKGAKQAVQMFGPAQRGVAMAVADCVEDGTIPADEADNLFVCVGVFIHWLAEDDAKIQKYNYEATKESIQRAVRGEPRAADVVAKKGSVAHPFQAK